MNFLVLSNSITGSILCHRLESEGHKYFYVNPFHRSNGISTIHNIYSAINNHIDAAIICDTGFTKENYILSQKGIPILGGTIFQDKLELDAEYLPKFLKQYNIRLLKPTTKKLLPISTELWFSDGNPLYQYLGYIKQTKFLAGDLGVDVDCESLVYWGYENRCVEAVKRIFEGGLFDILKEINYTGIMSFDSYVSEDDSYPYVFKAIPRLQAAPLLCMLELYVDNFGNFLLDLLHKESPTLLLKEDIAIAVAVSNPPYPYNQEGFIKYLVSSDIDWITARNKIGKEIKELSIPNIQYRIDAGYQAKYLDELKRINYLNN